ncbi:extensin family protein [Bosea sp. AAP35]|uniref:extensin-like domain-containing protein n=1 Tax=Bosea sp. AAP35 TaxID=1523417 RepID=UPI0006B9E169|nr:extensin family protein [Bosea sp. AAP35]
MAWAQPLSAETLPPRRPADLPARTSPPAPSTEPAPKPVQAPVADPAVAAPEPGKPGASAAPVSETGCLAALIAVHGDEVRAGTVEAGKAQAKDAACAVVEPVVMAGVMVGPATARRRIALQPPIVVSCTMATTVAAWLETSVQPLAKGHFDRDLTALRVGGGHECRRRNRAATGKLSEHSTGGALDIFAVVVGEGKDEQVVMVEKPDGPGHGAFLTAIRQSACGAFMTSLGPGSDAAHANHIHVDIQPRRAASSRFCQ